VLHRLTALATSAGTSRPDVTVLSNVKGQQAGSSKSVRPLPSSSTQFPQISTGGAGMQGV
jgi:hypothetical protein